MVEGSDTAVLMIHGITGTPEHFRELIPLIPQEWSLCNLLLVGHGAGVREFGAASMKKWKQQVSDRVDQLLTRHRRIFIVAHSMGTLFAIREAIRYPDQVAGLFLLNVPMRIHLPFGTIAAAVKNVFGQVKPEDHVAVAMQQSCSVQLTPYLWQYVPWILRYAELLREIGRVRAVLPQLTVPAGVFQGQKDEVVSLRSLKDLRACSRMEVKLLAQSGHFEYTEKDLAVLRTDLKCRIEKMITDPVGG